MNNEIDQVSRPVKKEIFLFRTSLVGTSNVKKEDGLWELMPEVPLLLQREVNNKFDKYAISVFTEDHKPLGYIPRTHNKILARLMDAGKILYAREYVALNMISYWEVEIEVFMMDY